MLYYRSRITNKCVEILLGFIDAFLPNIFRQIIAIIRESLNALEATQARSVLWMCMDYDSSSVVSCREMQPSLAASSDNYLPKEVGQKCINKT
jgi:hypothetical protein